MHRHGYKGRKFHRETDQRRAMMKSLADSLIEHGSIETTISKAKELRPYVEKLVTKAKKGDLHNRRQIISKLHTLSSAHKLVDEIAPRLKGRTSGYLRIERTTARRGDNAQMARIEFVDDIASASVSPAPDSNSQDAKPKTSPAASLKNAPKSSAEKPKPQKAKR